MSDAATTTTDAILARVAQLEAELAAERDALAAERERAVALTAERDRLSAAYQDLRLELELMRRRLFVAKAERLDTAQLELEFASKLAALDALNQRLGGAAATGDGAAGSGSAPRPAGGTAKRTPTGRRDLRDTELPEERIELTDPSLEGSAERIGWEESYQLRWRRGGLVRLVQARAKYREPGTATESPTIITAPVPPQLLPRSLAAPSLLAHILSEKFCDGLPFHRQQDRFARLGQPVDRGSMIGGVTLGSAPRLDTVTIGAATSAYTGDLDEIHVATVALTSDDQALPHWYHSGLIGGLWRRPVITMVAMIRTTPSENTVGGKY